MNGEIGLISQSDFIDPSIYISYFHCSDYGCNFANKAYKLIAFKFEA